MIQDEMENKNMKMKLKDVVVLYNELKQLLDNKNNELDIVVQFTLLGILKELDVPFQNYNSIKENLAVKYGEDPDDEGVIKIKKEYMDKFYEESKKLLDSDVDLKIEKIPANKLFNAGIPSDILLRLYDYIEM